MVDLTKNYWDCTINVTHVDSTEQIMEFDLEMGSPKPIVEDHVQKRNCKF